MPLPHALKFLTVLSNLLEWGEEGRRGVCSAARSDATECAECWRTADGPTPLTKGVKKGFPKTQPRGRSEDNFELVTRSGEETFWAKEMKAKT